MSDFDASTGSFTPDQADDRRPPRNSTWNPLRAIVGRIYRKPLLERGPALTFPRLCTSRHLGDLQWLAVMIIVIGLLGLANVAEHWAWKVLHYWWAAKPLDGWRALQPVQYLLGSKTDRLHVHVSAELGTALLGAELGALSFLYQTASRRIGTVDLFASEISVLCRIFVVADFATTSVARAVALQAAGGGDAAAPTPTPAKDGGPPEAARFSSEEQYTPAYDNHLAELTPLDVDVIIHVTEFYFYRKVMVDCLRALPNTPRETAAQVMLQMLYMQFLMYESARMAVGDLVEFEPRKSESLVSILCSELVIFGYLYHQFGVDYRGQRLHLRRDDYRGVVIDLLEGILEGGRHPLWLKARTTGAELLWRYQAMCQHTGMDPGVPQELARAFPREQPAEPPLVRTSQPAQAA
jgi:hypothetical protein